MPIYNYVLLYKLCINIMLFKKKKCKKKRFIVSLGAGKHQVPLIEAAFRAGFPVIGIDQNTTAPGLDLCTLKIQESILDIKSIEDTLLQTCLSLPMAVFVTRSYGEAVVSAAKLNLLWNRPFLSPETASIFLSKKEMKEVFLENNISTPKQTVVTSRSTNIISKLDYPVMVKPETGHGKTDVRLVENMRKLMPLLKKNKSLITEEYIEGDEVIAAGIIHKGTFTLLSLSDKERTELPWFSDLGHYSPSKYSSRWNDVEAMGQDVAQAFTIENAPLIMEIIFQNETLFLIEAVPEFGGEYIADYLIPLSSGLSLFTLSLLSSAGCIPPIPKKVKEKKAVAIKYITSEKEGKVTAARVPSRFPSKNHIFGELFVKPGDKVSPPKENSQRLGVVVAQGKNLEEAKKHAQKMISSIILAVK
jgi:biotin carboxylase